MTAEDDAAAIEALKTRDPHAVRRLVEAWTPAMLRIARLHVASPAAAEDAVQESWVIVLTAIERFEGRSSLRTYVLGIVVNVARRTGLAERRAIPFSSAWRDERSDDRGPAVPPERFDRVGGWIYPPQAWAASPDSVLSAVELRRAVESALDELPLRQRAVMTARDVLGLSAGDVGGLYDVSEGNQRVLLHRARAKVRAAVEVYVAGDCDADSAAAGPIVRARSRRPAPPRRGQSIACHQLVELVDDYLEGRLQADLRARVEQHLAGCEHCGEYVGQVRRVLDVTSSIADSAPRQLVDRLCAALRGDHARPGSGAQASRRTVP